MIVPLPMLSWGSMRALQEGLGKICTLLRTRPLWRRFRDRSVAPSGARVRFANGLLRGSKSPTSLPDGRASIRPEPDFDVPWRGSQASWMIRYNLVSASRD